MGVYEFWYDYVKPKYGENAKLCCMNTNSLVVYIKTEEIYIDLAKNVETRFNRKTKEKNVGLMKNELDGKLLTWLAAPRLFNE